jgi:F0F1-type ATP synthase assembly protein I
MSRKDIPGREEEKYRWMRQVGLLTAIPTVLAAGPLIGFFIGNYLDKKFQTYPWLTFAGIILGFIASGKETITLIRRADRESKDKNGGD